jgi:gas vesicle protein
MNQEWETTSDGGRQFGVFASGLAVGALIGAAVALLFAPKSGAELRSQVTDSAKRFKRRAGEAYNGATDAASEVIARGRRAFEAGRDAYRTARPGEGDQSAAADASRS